MKMFAVEYMRDRVWIAISYDEGFDADEYGTEANDNLCNNVFKLYSLPYDVIKVEV